MGRKAEVELSVRGEKKTERAYRKAARELERANRKISASSRDLEKQTISQTKTLTSSISAQKAVVLGLAGLLTGTVARSFIRTQKNIDRITNALKVGTGTYAGDAKEFAFIEKESARLELELQSTALS